MDMVTGLGLGFKAYSRLGAPMGVHHITSRLLAAFVMLCFALSAPGATAGPAATRLADLEGFVQARMALDQIPGLTLGYYEGQRQWIKGYGYAHLETRTPVSPESVYRLASVTKPLTATAIMLLVEQGRLKLDDEIQAHVPDFRRYPEPITIRRLLSHLGGIRHNSPAESYNQRAFTTRETVRQYNSSELLARPGTQFNYSTPGFNLLGAAIESASGLSYGEFLARHIWDPLELKTMALDRPREMSPHKVAGYNFVDGQLTPSAQVDVSNKFAAGGLQSSVGDLLGFARGLNRGQLLSDASRRIMYTRQTTRDNRFAYFETLDRDYALGWFARPVNGVTMRYHDGGQPETTAVLVNFPTQDMAIALACNREWADVWPYVAKLYTTITGRNWEIQMYSPRPEYRVVWQAMQTIFSQGVAAFEQRQFATETLEDPRQVRHAVDFFNLTLSPSALAQDSETVGLLVEAGRHPVRGQVLVYLGAHMMHRLQQAHGPRSVALFQQKGALDFFGDYIKMSRHPDQGTLPRFSTWFEDLGLAWQQAWQTTWTPAVRDLYFAAAENASPQTVNLLAQQLSGKSLYPDFSDRLLEVCRLASGSRDWRTYFQAATLAADLYPTHDTALGYRAIALLIFDRAEEAQSVLRQAATLKPDGFASPRNLESNARALATVDLAGPSAALLNLAKTLRQ